MILKEVTIINKLGLHARAAAKLVKCASRYGSEVHLKRKGQQVNGKSIMGVMMLAASQGSTLSLTISGEDENEAFDAIDALINNRFGEEE
ncbi:MAG: HPr family phosphocarrier protein [endosymbiont of Seepiophila jonesi]|uniref:HPr family phosphocarrier protein n=1 Tax=endosymbiont of Lamellibrachia luymesi TaxID=2200907 RepID=A0A370DUT9_9GAMM|nr:MAG: HPr family phosphocarrier protein [endosymbiont of Lamellibrachia luymesi]RDH91891.1 MAG: HPr family phosphocarrier protein [endosymbiont of Seepiophila jonesi]